MIYHLVPDIQRKIWGGKNLEQLKSLPAQSGVDPVGETWEISIHPDGPSFCNGKNLNEYVTSEELPYLVKFIDTGEELSIQVHPNNEYAKIHENSSGKSECWFIVSAVKDAGIYLGLKNNVTLETLTEGLQKKLNISHFLNFYPVRVGDFFSVPAGTIHAIGRGITMAEVQQSSGITYRVWDWDRVDSKGKPRELHIKKSLEVINFNPHANTPDYFKVTHGLMNLAGKKELITHDDFKMSVVNLKKNESITVEIAAGKRLASILNLQNKIMINGESVEAYSSVLFKNEKSLSITCPGEATFLLIE